VAAVYRRQGRLGEAEGQLRAVLAEKPDLLSAWLALAELCLVQKRFEEVENIARALETSGNGDASLLRARLLLEKRDYPAVHDTLAGLIRSHPEDVEPRRLLTYALLQEDRDLEGAEQALCQLIRLAPNDPEARHNLEVLHRRKQQVA